MKALSTNILVNHPAYPKILDAYNTLWTTQGKVNDKKFYEEVILREIPTYKLQTWYSFLERFKTAYGISKAEITENGPASVDRMAETGVAKAILTVKEAETRGIAAALNIASDRLEEILKDPTKMTAKDAIDLLFKAMKARDSRIHAIGKVREDNREEEKLNRAFSDSAYEQNG